jgi:glutathione S-transferase
MKLYMTDISGNSYKVRVLCSILNVPYVKRTPEAGLTLEGFPRVQAWLARCEAVLGWLTLGP